MGVIRFRNLPGGVARAVVAAVVTGGDHAGGSVTHGLFPQAYESGFAGSLGTLGSLMFERRLKLFLVILCGVSLRWGARRPGAGLPRDRWVKAAAETMKRSQLVETVRGNIYDRRAA